MTRGARTGFGVSFSSAGSTKKTKKFLDGLTTGQTFRGLESLAQQGVNALASATPVDSGLTANSWGYEIESAKGRIRISWINTNVVNGVNVAVILQYGHGTGTGGYVAGRDYINPAIKPIMDKIADEVWRMVISS
jgi:hypothetical protein